MGGFFTIGHSFIQLYVRSVLLFFLLFSGNFCGGTWP